MKEISIHNELPGGYNLVTGLEHFGPDGLGKLAKLEEVAFGGHGEDVYTLKMIDTVGFVMGAISPANGELVGAIEVLPIWKASWSEKQAFIHGVLVHPDYQGKGLGSALIGLATQKAFTEGYEAIACTVSPINIASLTAFINNNHFLGLTFTKDFYGPGEHRFWVQKDKTYHSKDPESPITLNLEDIDSLEKKVGEDGFVISIQKKENGAYVAQLTI